MYFVSPSLNKTGCETLRIWLFLKQVINFSIVSFFAEWMLTGFLLHVYSFFHSNPSTALLRRHCLVWKLNALWVFLAFKKDAGILKERWWIIQQDGYPPMAFVTYSSASFCFCTGCLTMLWGIPHGGEKPHLSKALFNLAIHNISHVFTASKDSSMLRWFPQTAPSRCPFLLLFSASRMPANLS